MEIILELSDLVAMQSNTQGIILHLKFGYLSFSFQNFN